MLYAWVAQDRLLELGWMLKRVLPTTLRSGVDHWQGEVIMARLSKDGVKRVISRNAMAVQSDTW